MKAVHLLSATLAILTLQAFAWAVPPTQPVLAQDGTAAPAHEQPLSQGTKEAAVLAALRANGARVLALGERGGLDGHFVELAGGGAYGLYLTPDGHAVAGLLYGPDGTLLTGRQIEAARGGDADATHAGLGVSAAAPTDAGALSDRPLAGEASFGSAGRLAHAQTAAPAASEEGAPRHVETLHVETLHQGDALHQGVPLHQSVPLFQRSASAFGFTLGRAGPPVVAFADPHCRWSRSAVARLAQPALAGRLTLHVVPVGVLGAASAREAAAIASAGDPAMAWFGGAVAEVSAAGARRIERNNALFDAWGAGAVPLIVWRAKDGRVAHSLGDIDDIDAWLGTLRHE